MVELIVRPAFSLNADTGAVRPAQVDRGIHQLLQNRLGRLDKGMQNPLHPLQLHGNITHMHLPLRKGPVALDVQHFQPSLIQTRTSHIHRKVPIRRTSSIRR